MTNRDENNLILVKELNIFRTKVKSATDEFTASEILKRT
jgi:hypothetical protein